MPHLELTKKSDISSFRKIAIGTWQTSYDPTVYGTLKIRMEKALEYIDAFRQKTGRKLTVTHLVSKAIAEALRVCPDANAILRFNKVYLRKNVTLSILVVQTDGGDGQADLAAAKIEHADQKTLLQMADEMQATFDKVRARKDAAMEKGKSTIAMVPHIFMNAFLKLSAFLMYTLNLDLSAFELPKDAFGSAIITNVGSMGLDVAYVPLAPYTHVPIFVSPGAVKDEPVVDNGVVVAGKVMNVSASFDHRYIDGFHASVMSKTLREMLENPFERFDKLD